MFHDNSVPIAEYDDLPAWDVLDRHVLRLYAYGKETVGIISEFMSNIHVQLLHKNKHIRVQFLHGKKIINEKIECVIYFFLSFYTLTLFTCLRK